MAGGRSPGVVRKGSMGLVDSDIENFGRMAAGTLDPAFRMMLEARSAFHPEASASMSEADLIASAFFEEGGEVPLRCDALKSVMKRIDKGGPLPPGIELPDYLDKAPYELRYAVARALEREGWRPGAVGVRALSLQAPGSTIEENGGSMLLFESTAGSRVQRHKHLGEEYLLVLKGAMSEENEAPMPVGSLAFKEPGSSHAPMVAPDSDCAALIILTGGFEVLSSEEAGDSVFA